MNHLAVSVPGGFKPMLSLFSSQTAGNLQFEQEGRLQLPLIPPVFHPTGSIGRRNILRKKTKATWGDKF